MQNITINMHEDTEYKPEPNLVQVLSPKAPKIVRSLSSIFHNKKALQLAHEVNKEMKSNSAFPEKYQYCGYLSIRTDDTHWSHRYFVLSNNFLFGADTKYSTKLAVCIPLEGSNTKLTAQSSDMTFELNKYSFRANSPQSCKEWLTNIQKASILTIYDLYRFRYELGCSASSNSKVIAGKHKITNEEYAIKIMNKKKCADKKTLQREIQILKKLKSPFIVDLCDLFETKKYLYIVMEMCHGGELFDQIANMDYYNGDRYTEKDIIGIMHQLASGVQHMHNMGIVHRDLKPENILCVEPDSIKKIKIADFGISMYIDNKKTLTDSRNMMKTRMGTLSYTAPEILKYKPYDERVDYWSLGVIMYILVCGYPPFDGENDYDLTNEIIYQPVEFDEEDWCHVGQCTPDLIDRLLSKNPRRRATCQDIIEHSWKIDVKNTGFLKAHNKFKQTVFKRKVQSRTRVNTPILGNIVDRMHELQELNINALDDSAIDIVQFDSQQKEHQICAWNVGHNRQKSKTMECLDFTMFSSFGDENGMIITEDLPDLPDLPCFDAMTYSNRSSMVINTDILTPVHTSGNSASYTLNGLSCLTSQSFMESFTNKRKFVAELKSKRKRVTRSKKGNVNKILQSIPENIKTEECLASIF